MRHILRFFLIPILLSSYVLGTTLVMPLNQVKPGMKGKGKSVFLGSSVEEFDVEILGVLDNVQPKRNLILAGLSGKDLENTGVISGMSGSPVYIGGKLIGAIAYSFPFAKKPIVGITPISEMLVLSDPKAAPKPSFSQQSPFRSSLSIEDLLEKHPDVFLPKGGVNSGGQSYLPLSVPLVFGGFSSKSLEKSGPLFKTMGFTPVVSGSSTQGLEKLSSDLFLQEGAPVGIQLVGGDLSLSAVGTVTHVDGDKILAFGHPFYNLGSVDYAMTRATILAVVPSLVSSFKVATTGALIGAFTQDRTSGVLGVIGRMPRLIPVNVKKSGSGGKPQEFKLKMVVDRILSPLLLNLTLSSILTSEERSYGDLSLELDGDIYLDNGLNVHLEDLYVGNLGGAVADLSGLLTAVVYYLANNEFQDIGIHRIDLSINSSEEIKSCQLERVWLDKYEASPGETIQIKVFYRTYRGEVRYEEIPLPVPNLPSSTEFTLMIGDSASMQQLEMSLYKSQDFVPRSLHQLIRILNNLRRNNRIYFKIIAGRPGLFIKGEELPNLPLTVKSMFTSPRAASTAPTELNRSTLGDYQLPVSYVFKGTAAIPIRIKK